jgi:hypothetical protein
MSASQVRHEALEIDATLRGARAGNRDVRRVATWGAKLMVQ